MPNYRRRSGESASHWRARLRAVDAAKLTRRQINDLTTSLIEAQLAERREGAAPMPHAERNTAAHEEETACADPLESCKEAIKALSAEDRLRLLWWIHGGMGD